MLNVTNKRPTHYAKTTIEDAKSTALYVLQSCGLFIRIQASHDFIKKWLLLA